jgi:hypothetical protein
MDVLRHVGGIDGLDKLLLSDGGKGDEAVKAMAAFEKAQAAAEAATALKEAEGEEEKK